LTDNRSQRAQSLASLAYLHTAARSTCIVTFTINSYSLAVVELILLSSTIAFYGRLEYNVKVSVILVTVIMSI
jgi:hypothetical protein